MCNFFILVFVSVVESFIVVAIFLFHSAKLNENLFIDPSHTYVKMTLYMFMSKYLLYNRSQKYVIQQHLFHKMNDDE